MGAIGSPKDRSAPRMGAELPIGLRAMPRAPIGPTPEARYAQAVRGVLVGTVFGRPQLSVIRSDGTETSRFSAKSTMAVTRTCPEPIRIQNGIHRTASHTTHLSHVVQIAAPAFE